MTEELACFDQIAIPLPDSNPTPQKQAQSEVEFRRWAREERKLSLSEVGCNESLGWGGCRWNATPGSNVSNPRLFYYSKVWSFQWGSLQLKKFTDAITAHLPHVGVGANFSPSDYENEVSRPILRPPKLANTSDKYLSVFRFTSGPRCSASAAFHWPGVKATCGTRTTTSTLARSRTSSAKTNSARACGTRRRSPTSILVR